MHRKSGRANFSDSCRIGKSLFISKLHLIQSRNRSMTRTPPQGTRNGTGYKDFGFAHRFRKRQAFCKSRGDRS
jgi:hypothetical protein